MGSSGLISCILKSGKRELGFINYSDDPLSRAEVSWAQKIKKELGYEIPLENISLNGFEKWISQMES